jgi:hypothetical protein
VSFGATTSPVTLPYVEAFFAGPTTISQINLLARMSTSGLSLAFPVTYQVYVTDSMDASWIEIGSYNTQPTSSGNVAIALGTSYYTYGIMIVASQLGVDDYGNAYFQLCGVSAQ